MPLAFVSGLLFWRKSPLGYLLAPVYLVFLSILMAALTAKVIAMGLLGQSVMSAIVIIPSFGLLSIMCVVSILKISGSPVMDRPKARSVSYYLLLALIFFQGISGLYGGGAMVGYHSEPPIYGLVGVALLILTQFPSIKLILNPGNRKS